MNSMFSFYLVDLQSILFLMKFLEENQSKDSDATKNLLSATQVAIRLCRALKEKIKEFMNSLVITIQNMEEVWQITRSSSKLEIFQYVDQEKYLHKSLLDQLSSAYLIKWAQYFLARTQLADDLEKKKSENLMKYYINCLEKNQMYFISVLKALDAILEVFDQSAEHDQLRLNFIDRIIHLCFQQSIPSHSIFSVIGNGLFPVENTMFRKRFREIFNTKCLAGKPKDTFKDMINKDNPMVQLIELDSRSHIKSVLVRDLIQLVCEKIEIIREELLSEAFYTPTRYTLTYRSLFDESLISLPIHEKMIGQLRPILLEWQKQGFAVAQINLWNTLQDSDKQVACQIWNAVGIYLTNFIGFENLIEQAKRRIEEIKKTMENVTLCIQHFCSNASDKNAYLTHLQQLQKQIDEATTDSAKMSSEIEVLKPFTDPISSVIRSTIWQEYLKNNLESGSKLLTSFSLILVKNSPF